VSVCWWLLFEGGGDADDWRNRVFFMYFMENIRHSVHKLVPIMPKIMRRITPVSSFEDESVSSRGSPGRDEGLSMEGGYGFVGVLGSEGSDGSDGSEGSTGSSGSVGTVGSVGSPGSLGSSGFIGSEGLVGSVGSPGFVGLLPFCSSSPGSSLSPPSGGSVGRELLSSSRSGSSEGVSGWSSEDPS